MGLEGQTENTQQSVKIFKEMVEGEEVQDLRTLDMWGMGSPALPKESHPRAQLQLSGSQSGPGPQGSPRKTIPRTPEKLYEPHKQHWPSRIRF